MDDASASIFQNLKSWILNDGVCVTASFISVSGKVSMSESKSILQKFYCDYKDNISATFLVFKKKTYKSINEGDYVQYEAILVNETDLDKITKESLPEEILGKTLYAIQPKGVLFDKNYIKRDYLSLISNFNEDEEVCIEKINDDFSDNSNSSFKLEDVKNVVNNGDEDKVVEKMEDDSDELCKEKGTKRKLPDDGVEKTSNGEEEKICNDEEDLKKRKMDEKVKDNKALKPTKDTKKESNDKKKTKGNHKENKFSNNFNDKEVVTETFVDDDGFLITKSAVKATKSSEKVTKSQPLKNLPSKTPLEKSKSDHVKVPQKQTYISNFFKKK